MQVLRAIAASMVVLCHLGGNYRNYFTGTTSFESLIPLKAGVDLFFVLSGFIITFVHWKDLGQRSKLSLYIRKRLVRIMPLYLALLAIEFLFFYWQAIHPTLILPHKFEADQPTLKLLILNIFFLSPNTFVSASWTLCYEMLFYFFFCFSIVFGKSFLKWSCLLWGIIVIGLRAKHVHIDAYDGTFKFLLWEMTNHHILEFLFGVAVAAYIKLKNPKFNAGLLGLGIVLFILGLFIPDTAHYGDLCHAALAIGSAGIVLHLVTLETNRSLRTPRWLKILGDASYSTYLSHLIFMDGLFMVIATKYGYFKLHPTTWQLILVYFLILPCTLGVYFGIEKPFTEWSRKKFAR